MSQTYPNQAAKNTAIAAQQVVVNDAVGQPEINEANARLAEIKSAVVTG